MKHVEDQLRPMLRGDLAMVLMWRNSDEVRRYMYNRDLIAPEDHLRWFESASQDSSKDLLIFEHQGEPCGFVSLTRKMQKKVADWGFYLRPGAPAGSGRRLGVLALRYAFSEIGMHKVCGEVLGYNERSLRFHERLGFLHEGCLRQQHYADQRYHDVHCFGILAEEWAQRQKEVGV